MNEKLTLSTQLVNQIIGYLGSRPYQEVFQIVDAVQKEVQAQVGASNETAKTTDNAA